MKRIISTKFIRGMSLLFAIGVMSLNLIAQDDAGAKHFSLSEAQQYAIDNYYLSKNAALDIESAKKKVWETTAIGLPQVSTEGNYQHIPGDIPELSFGLDSLFNYMFGSLSELGYPPSDDLLGGGNEDESSNAIAPKNSISYSVTVSQLIFSGEYIVGLQASRVYKSLSEENYEKVKIDMKQNIAGSYFVILILEKNREVLETTIENLRMNLEHSEKIFEAGMMQDTDVDQQNLILKRTENDLTSINNQIETMYRMLKYQMGLSTHDQLVLSEDLEILITQNIISDSAYSFILEDNIDYKMLQTQEDLMKLSMDREKSLYLPSVSAFYSYNDKTNKTAVDFTINHMIGVGAKWTLFSSGMRNAKVAQARIEYEKAQNVRLQESERIGVSAKQSKYNYQTALKKYFNEKDNFSLSEKLFKNATEQFRQGVISSIELSFVNNQYLMAQLTYSGAMQELLNAKTELDKAHNLL